METVRLKASPSGKVGGVSTHRGEVFEQKLDPDDALNILDALSSSVRVLGESVQGFSIFRDLVQRYQVRGKSLHDANIAAATAELRRTNMAPTG